MKDRIIETTYMCDFCGKSETLRGAGEAKIEDTGLFEFDRNRYKYFVSIWNMPGKDDRGPINVSESSTRDICRHCRKAIDVFMIKLKDKKK